MELLAILIALILLQVWGSGGPVQRDGWFFSFRDGVAGILHGTPRRLVTVLLPGAVVVLVHHFLHGVAYGLPELMLFVVVLLYALGRGDISADLAEYLHRWQRGDFQAAFEQVRNETGTVQTEPTDASGLHAFMRRHFYYRTHERLFAVLFWFTLLGPAGAVVYRLALLDRDAPVQQDTNPDLLRLVHWLDWVPARLNAIGYALIGNFDACLDAWRPRVLDMQIDAAELIEACGDAALGLGPAPESFESRDEMIRHGAREIEAIEGLQRRALVLWVVAIAVILIRF